MVAYTVFQGGSSLSSAVGRVMYLRASAPTEDALVMVPSVQDGPIPPHKKLNRNTKFKPSGKHNARRKTKKRK